MQLIIQTPEGMVFNGDADSVHLPGVDGSFQILSNHAPLIAALKDGVVRVEAGTSRQIFNIKSGIVEVLKNKISVLTEGVA
jgi:F-type H+-transporting ATPase subunit epsilon